MFTVFDMLGSFIISCNGFSFSRIFEYAATLRWAGRYSETSSAAAQLSGVHDGLLPACTESWEIHRAQEEGGRCQTESVSSLPS